MAWLRLACSVCALLVLNLQASAANEGLRDALYEACEPEAENIISNRKAEGANDIQPEEKERIISGCKEAINTKFANGLNLNVDKEDVNGATFLMETVMGGLVEISKVLISAGADVNKTMKDGDSVLLIAVKLGRPNITDLLLSAGADINYINQKNVVGYGLTALEIANYLAIMYSYRIEEDKRRGMNNADNFDDVVDALERHGATVPEFESLTQLLESFGISLSEINERLKRRGADGELYFLTPLAFTAMFGRKEAVKLLLEAGADVNEPYKTQMLLEPWPDYHTALSYAVARGSKEITQMLLDAGADGNVEGKQALEIAARFGHVDICKMLLDAGVDANSGALIYAAENNHAAICQMLLDSGDDVDQQNAVGETALMKAETKDIAMMLIQAGADVNVKNYYSDSTALDVHAKLNHKNIVRLLLDAGVDANSGALIYASENNHAAICKMLLDAGADVNQQNDYGETALMKAETRDIAVMLIQAGADLNVNDHYSNSTALDIHAKFNHKDIVRLLLDAGADVNARALNAAAYFGNVDICQMLLDAGADADAGALIYAARNIDNDGNAKICQMLLDAGANVNKQDNDGKTALITVVERMDVAKMLVSAGADLNIRDTRGYNALFEALHRNYKDTARMLIEAGANIDDIRPINHHIASYVNRRYAELEQEINNHE